MKRFICALIVAVMLVCAFPLTLVAAAETTYTPIELGVETAVSVSRTDVEKNFTFTATEEGDYVFYSIGDYDTCGYLYEVTDNSFIDYSDDYVDDNFFVEFYLDKGEKINLKTTLYDFTYSANYKVVVDKMCEATAIVPETDTLNMYVGDEYIFDYTLSPVNSYSEYVDFISADSSVVEIVDGDLVAKKLGTTTVKLESENGLETSVTVNVIKPKTLELDKTLTVSGEEDYEFSFTPSEDGAYTIFTDFLYFGDVWIDGALALEASEGDAFYFEKGVEYIIYVNDYSGELGFDITVKKSTPTDEIGIFSYSDYGYATQYAGFLIVPLNGVITEPVAFEVSDTEIADVTSSEGNAATVMLKKPGTVNIKAIHGTASDSIDIEVKAMPSVTVEAPCIEEVDVYNALPVKFTASKDGVYRIKVEDSLGSKVFVAAEYDSGYDQVDITASAGESVVLAFSRDEYFDDSEGVFTITATELTKATSVKPVYETVEAVVDQSVKITLDTLPENTYLEGTGEWTTSDIENSDVFAADRYIANFYAIEAGEYTVTYTEDSLTATVKIKVINPEELKFNVEKEQTVADCYNNYIYSFTPDKSGVYVIDVLSDSYSGIDVYSDIIYPGSYSNVYSLLEGVEYKIAVDLYYTNKDFSVLIREPEYATEIKAYEPYTFLFVGGSIWAEYYAVDGDDCEHIKSITVADGKIAYAFEEVIVASAPGETVVEIETESGLKASFTLVVYAKDHAFADVYDLNKDELTLDVGKIEQLTVTTEPETESKVYWWSDDESVARVDANGRVTALAEGETWITAVIDGIHLYCSVETKAPAIVDSSKTFTDIKAGKWYSKAVDYAYSYGFIAGVSKTEFGLNQPVTRGMFITILARIAGVDTSGAANKAATTKFTDVKVGKYYTAAIQWASENGIVAGLTDTTFGPNASIERQQLCVMIVNFAKYMGIEIDEVESAITFKDSAKFAKYSKNAIAVCQKADIVNGYTVSGGYEFRPKNTATRGEAAQILYKFHKDFVMK